MAADCLFCRIVAGEYSGRHRPSRRHRPGVPRHLRPRRPRTSWSIPTRHIVSAASLTDADATLVGRLFEVIAALARSEGIVESGFRVVTNTGPDAGQSVAHLHLHLLGGRSMAWPPG